MAVHCKVCNSTDVQAGTNTWQCLRCGSHTYMSEVPYSVPSDTPDPDAAKKPE
jgi:ribosomal protein L37AE/L43A